MRRILFAALPIFALVAACSFPFGEVELTVAVPQTPETWWEVWGPTHYRVSALATGQDESVPIEVVPGGSARLTVPRDPPVLVITRPFWPLGGPALAPDEELPYAAALWPHGAQRERPLAARWKLEASFSLGSVGRVIERLLELQVDLRGFNVARLISEVAERLPDDPSLLDTERVAAAIAARSMRESYVREVEMRDLLVRFPPGRWSRASPFAPLIPGGGERVVGLPRNLTAFYAADGRRFAVWVDEEWRPDQAP